MFIVGGCMDKIIEVYTDGGYRPLQRVGAYAFGIKINGKTRFEAGIKKGHNLNSNYVEFTAFVEAIKHLKKKGILNKRANIVVYTDSLNLKNTYDGLCFFYSLKSLSAAIRKIKKRYGTMIEVVWVPRNSVFEQKVCDLRCNMAMDHALVKR
jgi:ribonuclease HI